ncbi:hypothetical protein ACP4OV_022425 [Aristida adscensionis]
MATRSASHRFSTTTTFQALTVVCVLAAAALAADDADECPPFSCAGLGDVYPPFRRAGDPEQCGDPLYELACTNTTATIHINTATYYVTRINYTASNFWVVDANLDMASSCPLPRSDQVPFLHGLSTPDGRHKLDPDWPTAWATFLNCSQEVRSDRYRPVDCMSTGSSFIYVSTRAAPLQVGYLEASCGFLAVAPIVDAVPFLFLAVYPLGAARGETLASNPSFGDVVRLMRSGFAVRFPDGQPGGGFSLRTILSRMYRNFREERANRRIVDLINVDFNFWEEILPNDQYTMTLWSVKWIAVLCRFVLAPLTIFIFLAHKYWKTRITIDAVEKFLQMQQMVGPTRYAYTDITAITSHFREKLGQGGYGSVYKGVLLPGGLHVAVKMLSSSKCNGEDFISEVSTIGRIHHLNVVRLMGFCSEEMRRALVYEYMPNGSLDKYIFSSEKRFSWDKLNEIALGIARGINYLHQGCDMQILHFDIKPHNILLDHNFVPKVADFGLAKLFPREDSFVPMSAMRGTIGYIAPEMVSRSFGVISSKSDVYSFGMLLLEMAGGRRNADPNIVNSSQTYYPSMVYSRLSQQDVGEISDANDMHELEKKLCIVGLWCIQMKSCERPTMSEVIEMLEAGVDALEMPPRPFFCDDEVAGSYYMSSELNTIEEDE